MKKEVVKYVIAIFLGFLVLGIFFWEDGKEGERECVTDNDCVKNACCHAKGCVSKKNAPNCSGIFCTMNCAPETLDCGQGTCKCIKGRCEVKWNE